jgi:hypothetical protein
MEFSPLFSIHGLFVLFFVFGVFEIHLLRNAGNAIKKAGPETKVKKSDAYLVVTKKLCPTVAGCHCRYRAAAAAAAAAAAEGIRLDVPRPS